MKPIISEETQEMALKIAKATQKSGQNKEQTKLIAQGIEKGIAEYKKQQKIKARERNKTKKQQQKAKLNQSNLNDIELTQHTETQHSYFSLPWGLLILSWLGFIIYALFIS